MTLVAYARKEIFVFTLGGVAAALAIAAIAYATSFWWLYFLCILPLGLAGFTLYFFRDPKRNIPREPEVIVAPADGKITEIAQVHEDIYLKTNARKIGIFLSLFNVHLNRAPYSGQIEFLKYTPGRFLNAGNLESSRVNESNAVGIVTKKSKLLLRQVAGVLARRIVCKLKEGDRIETGQKIGMIKFGSRTELYVPVDSGFELRVSLGQKVKAGESVIGVFHSEKRH
jgi:phosphatidylserine decarboxylase